ncbi:hypothetical protein H8E07_06760 [bacterium]|nr:hypothetical protein [bacterium]
MIQMGVLICRLITVLIAVVAMLVSGACFCVAGDDALPDSVAISDTGAYAFVVEAVAPFTNGVHGMAFASDGTLYYSDSYRNEGTVSRVYILHPPYDGRSEATGISGLNISGLLFRDDALYVCATGQSRVWRYGPDLALARKWVVPSPWNVEFVGDALFAVTYDGRVFALTDDGRTVPVLEDLVFPFDLADAGDGTFFVTEQGEAEAAGRVGRFDPQGRSIERLDHVFENPEGLARDDRGHLYIADTGAGKLLRASPDGRVELITDAYEIPIVVARGPDGYIYFNTAGAEPRLVRVRLF